MQEILIYINYYKLVQRLSVGAQARGSTSVKPEEEAFSLDESKIKAILKRFTVFNPNLLQRTIQKGIDKGAFDD